MPELEVPPLEVADIVKTFTSRRGGKQVVTAVDHVSFTIAPGAAVGLVGASGSGKSTIARIVTASEQPSSGTVMFGDQRVDTLGRHGRRDYHGRVQMVFQDPYGALNPLHTVEYAVMRPGQNFLGLSAQAARDRVHELLDVVGLKPSTQYAPKLPHQMSGGQRQRVVIARALACDPQVLVADEPVSMLDVSVRAGILRLLDDLREKGLGILMITHDLSTAAHFADRICVMYLGRIVEQGPARSVVRDPQHPYTKALISVVPKRDPRETARPQLLTGEAPNPVHVPSGCRFHPRCPVAIDACRTTDPRLRPVDGPAHEAACILLEGRRDVGGAVGHSPTGAETATVNVPAS
jgi:peptide/nickel transport system ATP-binding protein